MAIRLLATDYDGTFRITPSGTKFNKKAARMWRENGNLFGFVTGRGLDFTGLMKESGIEYDFLILNNGAVITDGDGKIIYESELSEEAFKLLESECEKIPDCERYSRFCEGEKRYLYYAYFDSPERVVEVASYLNGKYGDKLNAVANGKNLNVMTANEDKSSGIKNLCRLFNVDECEIAVAGDDYNDIDMLCRYNGFAVINAKPAVKKAAGKQVFSVSSLIKSLLKQNNGE